MDLCNAFFKKKKRLLSSSRFELETVCVLDRRDNQLHHEDMLLFVLFLTSLDAQTGSCPARISCDQ